MAALLSSSDDLTQDRTRHEHLIESLARETDAAVDHVRELFESQHAQLESEARIKTFVAVIATRLVRNVLHEEQRDATEL